MIFALALPMNIYASDAPLWSEGRPTPINGLSNPFELNEKEFKRQNYQGRKHALNYPVTTTGVLLPYYPIKAILESSSENPIKKILYDFVKNLSDVKSFDDMNRWLGLHTYPKEVGEGPYLVPPPDNILEERMGFTLMHRNTALGFTHSCAACHSNNLFGRKIIGLTNRFPRANQYFVKGKKSLGMISESMFDLVTDSTPEELDLIDSTKSNLKFLEATRPQLLGLDTSLAHVAISLSHRAKNEYADKNIENAYFPRSEPLRDFVADSKPGVWWNVKYKNRWLLDGSVVSGNPIFTNILWNEIGRGSNLKILENWLTDNKDIVDELTTAVFASEAPPMTDFFDENHFDLEKAKRGQKVFEAAKCYKCHGTYKKAWDTPNEQFLKLPWKEKFKTTEVDYPEQTLVKNVGTDPNRWKGMASLLQLNDLAISKNNGIKVKLQEGYVPPPLVGIWARWPYFHNNSVPSLCAIFTPPEMRPVTYYSGEALNPETDFDFDCNGYPLGDKTPKQWEAPGFLYDTRRPGLTNTGHYKMFQDENGQEVFSPDEKKALIHFLQTL
jgi:hypothetical protein